MFYLNRVMKMLKCKKENLMISHFSTLYCCCYHCCHAEDIFMLTQNAFIYFTVTSNSPSA